ncbi:tellurite resistance/C4-dicarboxylate transporter family protein [Sneathiella sp.]|uniref:tellurite resistance/C4-dicarboxylate transporter family protein n=1 Tax=Sneathiella sp. TaxID=1964365 RepID=UPI003567760C
MAHINYPIFKSAIRKLHPSYFALVMGTGIVSIAFNTLGYSMLAYGLFYLNIGLYLILSGMAFSRLLFFPQDFITDIREPRHSWPYLTFIVGNNTIGAQFLIFWHATDLTWILWGLGFFFWIAFTYFILFSLVIRRQTDIKDTIDGAILLVIVSTASVALLGVPLTDTLVANAPAFFFGMWSFWAVSLVLYLIIITCVFYRKLSRDFEPQDWNGSYWICMGAVAIVSLTGTELVHYMADKPAWEHFRDPTVILTCIAWAIGTWWIPYQIIMDIWSLTRVNLDVPATGWIRLFPWSRLAFGVKTHRYKPSDWARVFPMGMYTACTLGIAHMTGLTFLEKIPQIWSWLALLIWGLTFIGLLRSAYSGLLRNDLSDTRFVIDTNFPDPS